VQIEILERLPDRRVKVRSVYGTFSAGWTGEPPEVGSSRWTEVNVDGIAVWGEDILVGDGVVRELVDDGDCVRISGFVEDFGADDVLVLTLDGSPVMIDTDGDPPLGVTGRYATVQARDVTLFPYEV